MFWDFCSDIYSYKIAGASFGFLALLTQSLKNLDCRSTLADTSVFKYFYWNMNKFIHFKSIKYLYPNNNNIYWLKKKLIYILFKSLKSTYCINNNNRFWHFILKVINQSYKIWQFECSLQMTCFHRTWSLSVNKLVQVKVKEA